MTTATRTMNPAVLDRFIERVYGMAVDSAATQQGDLLAGFQMGKGNRANWEVVVRQNSRTGRTTVDVYHYEHRARCYTNR